MHEFFFPESTFDFFQILPHWGFWPEKRQWGKIWKKSKVDSVKTFHSLDFFSSWEFSKYFFTQTMVLLENFQTSKNIWNRSMFRWLSKVFSALQYWFDTPYYLLLRSGMITPSMDRLAVMPKPRVTGKRLQPMCRLITVTPPLLVPKLKLKQFQPSITAKSQISKPMQLGKKSWTPTHLKI